MPLRNDRGDSAPAALALFAILLHISSDCAGWQMADFSERSATLRTNERIKHVVGMMTAWGNALIIAAFAQVGLASRFDFNSLMWLVCAAVFFWVSSNILKLLEAEESDG